jgi:hypothetical protein
VRRQRGQRAAEVSEAAVSLMEGRDGFMTAG